MKILRLTPGEKKQDMPKLMIIIFFLNSFITPLFPQKLSPGRYLIPFSNKTGNGYSIHSPQEFLSERSVQRRDRQNIPIITEDLPVNTAYIDSLKKLGLHITGVSKWFNAVIAETTDTSLLGSLTGISFIKEFNYALPFRVSALSMPSYPGERKSFIESSASSSLYGIAEKQINLLNGNSLHALGYRGDGKIIAVLDAGFYKADTYSAFDSLWQSNRIIAWNDFIEPGNPGFFLSDSHGMSVLSTMGANMPGILVGTAPEASYALLRSEDSGSENLIEEVWWLLAAEFADSIGADIINSSLGYSTFDDSTMNYTNNDMDGKTAISTIAAEKAFSKGMIVVVSAGNEGNKSWKKITAPSDGRNVLAVGAIDTFRIPAPFSSTGPSSDYRVKPDVVAVGLRTAIITATGLTGWSNGTSFSSPQIAGLIACLWQAVPEKTNLEIIDAVRRSSSRYYAPDNFFGYGIPDFLFAFNQLKHVPGTPSENNLLIIPNPNYGIFEIHIKDLHEEVRKILIYDVMGRNVEVIYDPEIRSGYYRIEQFINAQPGLYYIIVRTQKKDYSAKMIKLE
jgi:serine protease AprX